MQGQYTVLSGEAFKYLGLLVWIDLTSPTWMEYGEDSRANHVYTNAPGKEHDIPIKTNWQFLTSVKVSKESSDVIKITCSKQELKVILRWNSTRKCWMIHFCFPSFVLDANFTYMRIFLDNTMQEESMKNHLSVPPSWEPNLLTKLHPKGSGCDPIINHGFNLNTFSKGSFVCMELNT